MKEQGQLKRIRRIVEGQDRMTYNSFCSDEGIIPDSDNSLVRFVRECGRHLMLKAEVHHDPETDGNDIHVECPCCGNTECQSVDEARHHLQQFELIDWVLDRETETSDMKCHVCGCLFELQWHYHKEFRLIILDEDEEPFRECGSLEEAEAVLNEMLSMGKPTTASMHFFDTEKELNAFHEGVKRANKAAKTFS